MDRDSFLVNMKTEDVYEEIEMILKKYLTHQTVELIDPQQNVK